uniref:Uncharacterized protein n=1 Tax=Oryza glumipatula TaxID=40148 RepID=A0A0E0BQN8_9ORYZ
MAKLEQPTIHHRPAQNTQRWPPEVSPLPSAAQGDAARPPVPSASRTRRSWWWLPRRAAGGAHGRRWERSTPRRRSCTGAPELTGGDMGRGGGGGGGGARPCALEFVRGARRERERESVVASSSWGRVGHVGPTDMSLTGGSRKCLIGLLGRLVTWSGPPGFVWCCGGREFAGVIRVTATDMWAHYSSAHVNTRSPVAEFLFLSGVSARRLVSFLISKFRASSPRRAAGMS